MYRFRLKKTTFSLLVLCAASVWVHATEVRTTDKPLLTHMRVLSESRGLVWRAYKNYIMIGIENPYNHPKQRLPEAIDAFEKSMKASRAYAIEKKLAKMMPHLDQADKEWNALKAMLLAPPDKEKINAIDVLAMKDTRTIIKALKAMGSYDPSGNWKYLEQTQKAQNIAQRMATLYLDNVWGGLKPERYQKMMQKVTGNYKKVEKLVYQSKFLTPEIDQVLKSAHQDYRYFEMMWKGSRHTFIPTLIYKKSSDMDEKLGQCTTLILEQISQ